MVKQLYRQSIVPDIKCHSLLEFFNPLPCHLNPLRIISEGDEFLEVRDGFLFPAYVTVGYALVVAGIGMLRVEADGLVVVLDAPLELPQVAVGVAPVVVGIGMLRVEVNSLVVVLDSPLELPQNAVGIAPVVVGPGMLRVEADGLVVVVDGPLELPQVVVGATPVVVGIGVLRVEADGLVVVLDGPLELPQVAVGVAPVVVGRGMLRVEADGRTELSYSLIVASLFSQVYTSVVVPLSRAFRWAASNKDATGNRSHRKQRGNKFSLNRPPPLLLILPMRPSYTNATITGEDCQYQIREYMNFMKSLAAEKGTILTKY